MRPRDATALGAVFLTLAAVAPELPQRPPVSERPSRPCELSDPTITPLVTESEVLRVVAGRVAETRGGTP